MKTVRDILYDAVARSPHAVALVDGDRSWTYAELLADARTLAQALEEIASFGGRVATMLTNRAELALLHWAAQLVDVVITPLNWRASAEDLDHFLKDSGAQTIIFEAVSAEAVDASSAATKLQKFAVGKVDVFFHQSFEYLLIDYHIPIYGEEAPVNNRTSVLLYTSGTTGPGKGVPRSDEAERAAALAHVAQSGICFGDSTLGVMPLYHTMGVRLLLAMGLVSGAFICQRRFDADEAVALINHHQISGLYLVPTLYHDLLEAKTAKPDAFKSVRKLGFAGAPMTDGLLRRLTAIFQPELIVNHYGSSEIYTYTIDQQAHRKPGSSGKAGINSNIRIVKVGADGPDDTVPNGVEGEIIANMASDEAFNGYWNNSDADARAIRDGWYFTGDVGYFDDDLDLFVVGRVDDMMISGGENVLPVEIESVLSLHESVAEVAVVGLPDARLGHKITAFVVPFETVDADALDAWCLASGLAAFKRPKAYVYSEAIPKSPVGKILRRCLIDDTQPRIEPRTRQVSERVTGSVVAKKSSQN